MPTRRVVAAATTAVGVVIAVLGFGFVIQRLAANWGDVRDAIRGADRAWLVVAFVLACGGMSAVAIAWRWVVNVLGGRVSVREVFRWYFPGELGKYVPGGIWPVVGRAELAFRGGVRRSIAYASVALSLGALYLAAIAVVVVMLPFALSASHDSSAPLLVILLLPVGLVALHPRVLHMMRSLLQRVARRDIDLVIPPWRTSLLVVLRYVPAWAFIGSSTWFVARALDPHAPFGQVFVAAVASWVIGFVLVPVPGGIGVREAAFVALAGLSGGVGAAVALVARLMFMAVDLLGALGAPLLPSNRPSSGPAVDVPVAAGGGGTEGDGR